MAAQRWIISIEHFAKRPLTKIDPDVLAILRLSLFQLLHLDRVPAAAVVDDAVSLTRAARKPSASGFVNAVLRSMLRQRHELPLPPRPDDAGRPRGRARLSRRDALASRLARRAVAGSLRVRPGTKRWVQFNNEHAPLTLRANTLRVTREQLQELLSRHDVETAPTRYAPDGLIVTSGNPLRTSEDDSFFVQDEASQLVPLVVDAQPGERILDLCASPGGKTVAMAASMNDSGTLVACDVRAGRVALLRDTVRSSGAHHVHIVHVPASGPLPFAEHVRSRAGGCSVLGPGHDPPRSGYPLAARGERSAASGGAAESSCSTRAAAAVRPGGRLVYATCSSEPEENERVVEAFLERAPFDRLDLRESGRHAPLQPSARRPRHAAHAAIRARARGVLRRGDGPSRPVSALMVR